MRILAIAVGIFLLATPISPGVANALTSVSAPTDSTDPEDGTRVRLFGEDGPRLYEEDLHALIGDHGPGGDPVFLSWTRGLDDGQRLCPQDPPGEIFRPPWLRS